MLHNIATHSTAAARPRHPIPVSLSILTCSSILHTTPHIHPITPISACQRAIPSSPLKSQVPFPCSTPPCTQLPHSTPAINDSVFPKFHCKFSLVYLLAWHLPLHTPYIFSPNHCLLFATHAHTIAACFAVVPRLCYPILVFLSQPFTETLSCSLMPHIRLTILVSAH